MSSVDFSTTTTSFDFRLVRPNQSKRTKPEEAPSDPTGTSKRARMSEVAQEAIHAAETAAETSSRATILPSAKPKLVLKSTEIAAQYWAILKSRSVLRRIDSGKITVSSKIDVNEYTFFEAAIFCNEWALATKILLNHLNGEISIQRNRTLITDFYILAWAAEKQQWDFILIFLQRGLRTLVADQAVPSLDPSRVERVYFNFFDSVLPPVELAGQLGMSLSFTLASALQANRIDLVNLILEKYNHLPTLCWKKPLFLFLTKKMWLQTQRILCAHPELAALTLASLPYNFNCIEEWKNATILLLLCSYGRLNIIYSIAHHLDYMIFFKPNSDHSIHKETNPFCLLALKGEKEVVAYLLECVSEDRSYDIMRGSRYSYQVSIFGYAVESKKWNMALTILQYHRLNKAHSHELTLFINEKNYLMEIASHCLDEITREDLLNYCNHYLSFLPLREDDPVPLFKPFRSRNSSSEARGLDSWDLQLRSLILENGVV